jgi:hypothetical protein
MFLFFNIPGLLFLESDSKSYFFEESSTLVLAQAAGVVIVIRPILS